MTISANVRKELFEMTATEGRLIRIKPTEAKAGTTVYSSKQAQPLKMWTQEEHERFLEAMEKYPAGPWKVIAAFIGSKTTRQTMTHAQKYRQKIGRWRRGLRHKGRKQAPGDADADAADAAKENLFKAIDYVSGDEMSCYGGAGDDERASPARSAAGSVNDERSELFRLAELASIEGMKQEPPSPASCYPPLPSLLAHHQQQHHHHQQYTQHHHQLQQQAPEPPTVLVVPSSPADVEMADVSRVRIKQERTDAPAGDLRYKLKQEQQAFAGDWRGRRPEARLSPLRGEGRVLHAVSGFLSAQHPSPLPASRGFPLALDGGRGPFAAGGAPAFRLPPLNIAAQSASACAIPPLRSKIDPSVLVGGRPHVAPTH